MPSISQDPRTTRLAASHHHHRFNHRDEDDPFASQLVSKERSRASPLSLPPARLAPRPLAPRPRDALAGARAVARGRERDAPPRSARWRRVAGRGTTTTAPAAGAVPGAPRASSPRAPSRLALARDLPARVYIEHTDAYRVVYHANYFKFMRRAREAIFFGEPTTTPDRSPAADDPTNDDGWLSGWADAATVVAVDACRFASPLVLGDDLVVRTRVLAAGARTLAVRQEVVRPPRPRTRPSDSRSPPTSSSSRSTTRADPSPSRERSETASSAARRTMVFPKTRSNTPVATPLGSSAALRKKTRRMTRRTPRRARASRRRRPTRRRLRGGKPSSRRA